MEYHFVSRENMEQMIANGSLAQIRSDDIDSVMVQLWCVLHCPMHRLLWQCDFTIKRSRSHAFARLFVESAKKLRSVQKPEAAFELYQACKNHRVEQA